MALVVRELKITYAGVAVGKDSDYYLLHMRHTTDQSYRKGRLVLNVVCRGTTEAEFETKKDALEAAYRKPWQDTTVVLGATTLISWSHASGTGYNAEPGIRKVGGDFDTERSCEYECSVEVELPADLAGQAFRRESTVTVTTDPSTRKGRLEIAGTYTCNGATAARAQYLAAIGAYVSSVQSALGGTWQLLGKRAQADDQDKNCEFSEEYEEVPAGTADSGLLNAQLTISRERTAPGDTPGHGARRLTTFRATITGQVPFGTDARTRWEGTTRPWLLGRIRTVFGVSSLAVEPDQVSINTITNEVSASITAQAPEGGSVLGYVEGTTIADDHGLTRAPVWSSDPFRSYVFTRPAARLRTTTIATRELGDTRKNGSALGGGLSVGIDIGGVGIQIGGGGDGGGSQGGVVQVGFDLGPVGVQFGSGGGGAGVGGGASGGGAVGNWVEMSRTAGPETTLEIGLPGESLTVTDKSLTITEEWIVRIPATLETGISGGG